MFSTDKPITDASEDKLGRSGFAERFFEEYTSTELENLQKPPFC